MLLPIEILYAVACLFVVPEGSFVLFGVEVRLIVPCLLLFQLKDINYMG